MQSSRHARIEFQQEITLNFWPHPFHVLDSFDPVPPFAKNSIDIPPRTLSWRNIRGLWWPPKLDHLLTLPKGWAALAVCQGALSS